MWINPTNYFDTLCFNFPDLAYNYLTYISHIHGSRKYSSPCIKFLFHHLSTLFFRILSMTRIASSYLPTVKLLYLYLLHVEFRADRPHG